MEDGDINTNDLYRECLRNHAANLGSHATDGCREFTPDDTTSPGGPLQCAACGCHRNFHRKITYSSAAAGRGITCRSLGRDPEMSAEMIEHGGGGRQWVLEFPDSVERSGKRRFRTKFTEEQKEKMMGFAEKLGWKMQRREEDDEIERFCRGVGVSRQVFKVWMHNHKNSSSASSSSPTSIGNASSLTTQ